MTKLEGEKMKLLLGKKKQEKKLVIEEQVKKDEISNLIDIKIGRAHV
mgnify:CR=1 FL=1